MAHVIYDNFYLSNEVEDQYNSHLDLQPFCTVDNTLTGVPGMKRKINVYSATDGTQKLAMGEGNTKSIEVSYIDKEYEILMAQNRFEYYDEQAMIDPMLVPVGTKHMGTDLFNTVNAEIFAIGCCGAVTQSRSFSPASLHRSRQALPISLRKIFE